MKPSRSTNNEFYLNSTRRNTKRMGADAISDSAAHTGLTFRFFSDSTRNSRLTVFDDTPKLRTWCFLCHSFSITQKL